MGAGNLLDIWSDKSQPFAAKTGTTQNWEDAWTVGFSPYVTTAVWYGFDEGNRSLGTALTGAAIAGPTWAHYMKAVHKDLPVRRFIRPETGLSEVVVSATSGLLPTAFTKRTITEIFLSGTEPRAFDEIDEYNATQTDSTLETLKNSLLNNPALTEAIPRPLPHRSADWRGGGNTTAASLPRAAIRSWTDGGHRLRLYTKDHTWVRRRGQRARVGISDFAQIGAR